MSMICFIVAILCDQDDMNRMMSRSGDYGFTLWLSWGWN